MASDLKSTKRSIINALMNPQSVQPRFHSGSKATTCDDPERLIWYGPCMYWTDDWTRVADRGIPCCPVCGAPGFQMPYWEWFEGADRFAMETNQSGYPQWLQSIKETCSPDMSQWKTRTSTLEKETGE